MAGHRLKLFPQNETTYQAILHVAAQRGVPVSEIAENGRRGILGPAALHTVLLDAIRELYEESDRRGQIEFWPSLQLGLRAQQVYYALTACLHLPGDAAECGVYYGETARDLVRILEATHSEKVVHLFDTFAGFPDVLTADERAVAARVDCEWMREGGLAAPLDVVRDHLRTLRQYRVHQGPFAETFPAFDRPLCFIHADADLYASTHSIIALADRLLVSGGRVVFDDYGDERFGGVRRAVTEALDPRLYDLTVNDATGQATAIRRNR